MVSGQKCDRKGKPALSRHKNERKGGGRNANEKECKGEKEVQR